MWDKGIPSIAEKIMGEENLYLSRCNSLHLLPFPSRHPRQINELGPHHSHNRHTSFHRSQGRSTMLQPLHLQWAIGGKHRYTSEARDYLHHLHHHPLIPIPIQLPVHLHLMKSHQRTRIQRIQKLILMESRIALLPQSRILTERSFQHWLPSWKPVSPRWLVATPKHTMRLYQDPTVKSGWKSSSTRWMLSLNSELLSCVINLRANQPLIPNGSSSRRSMRMAHWERRKQDSQLEETINKKDGTTSRIFSLLGYSTERCSITTCLCSGQRSRCHLNGCRFSFLADITWRGDLYDAARRIHQSWSSSWCLPSS